jgi:hypothetical protein
LQDCLGAVNDGAVGRQLIRSLIERAAAEGELDANGLQRVQGMVLGWQAREIQNRMTQFGGMWKSFAEVKRFWRSRK